MSGFIILATFMISGIFTYGFQIYSRKVNLLDHPNHRSSHYQPTPRAGGLIFVSIFLGALFIFSIKQAFSLFSMNPNMLLISGLMIAGIGLIDDYYSVATVWRFCMQCIAVILSISSFHQLPSIYIYPDFFDLGMIGYLLFTMLSLWLINLYNFMDGIDGLAATEAILVSLSMAVILWLTSQYQFSGILILLAASVGGFLLWNWSPASLFMGDIGSGFLGFSFAMFMLLSAIQQPILLYSWSIVLAPFIIDSSLTLIQRMCAGEVWYQAHAKHNYQLYSRYLIQQHLPSMDLLLARSLAHRQINYYLIGFHCIWLLPLAILVNVYPQIAVILWMIALLPLIFIDFWIKKIKRLT